MGATCFKLGRENVIVASMMCRETAFGVGTRVHCALAHLFEFSGFLGPAACVFCVCVCILRCHVEVGLTAPKLHTRIEGCLRMSERASCCFLPLARMLQCHAAHSRPSETRHEWQEEAGEGVEESVLLLPV